jgi:hypothetical protein
MHFLSKLNKKGDDLSPLLFNFSLEYTIRNVQENKDEFEFSGTHLLLIYIENVNLLDDYIITSTDAIGFLDMAIGL